MLSQPNHKLDMEKRIEGFCGIKLYEFLINKFKFFFAMMMLDSASRNKLCEKKKH